MPFNSLLPFLFLFLLNLSCQATKVSDSRCSIESNRYTPDRVYEEDEVDKEATLIGGFKGLFEKIEYPRSALLERVSGVVEVDFVVNEVGCVTALSIRESVDPRLDAEALRVVQTAEYQPARVGEQPAAVRLMIPISFKAR